MHLLRLLALLIPAQMMFGGVGSPDTFYWSGRIPAGQIIEVKGVNGGIHAESTPGGVVEIIAQKAGVASDPSEVGVEVVEHDGGVTVCAVYPTGAESPCQPGQSSSLFSGSDVQVEFIVRVPSGVRFVGRTVNGLVEAASLEADAEAHTVNGNIRLRTTGSAQAETINGSINAAVGRVAAPTTLSTVNGGITVEMAPETHAEVRARTVTGGITSNFPLVVHGRLANKHAHTRIGGGGPEVRIVTVNGSINLHHSACRGCSEHCRDHEIGRHPAHGPGVSQEPRGS